MNAHQPQSADSMVSAIPVQLYEGKTMDEAVAHLVTLMEASVGRFDEAAARLHVLTERNAQLNEDITRYIDVLRTSITGTVEYR
jgi:hypothetical protein